MCRIHNKSSNSTGNLLYPAIFTRTFPNQISGEEILSAISSPAQLLPLSHNTPPDLPPSAFSPAPSPLLPSGCTARDSLREHSDLSNNTGTVFSQISQTDWSACFSALLSYMEEVLPEKKKDNTENVLNTMINVNEFLKN